MTQKKHLKLILITGLIVISLGGWLLHLRTHPPAQLTANLVPFILGILSVLVIPAMFFFEQTSSYAYVINGMTVIIGTITMAHFSIVMHPQVINFYTIIMNTTFADILMLWTKFALGKALFDLNTINALDDIKQPPARYWFYPNMGWWLVHLILMSAVYALGNLLWV